MKTPEPGLNGLGVLAGVAVAVAAAASLLLSGCGGGGGSGGGGGGGGTGGTATLLSITAQGAGAGLWQWVAGNPSTPPVCPASVYVNGEIVFTFDGAVSPSTVPNFGFASGTINITATVSGFVAAGTFIVQDDPGFPAGNQRRVVFKPNLPTSATAACTAGLEAGQNYQIFVPGGGGANVVNVAGASLTNSATACFSTCGCPNPATCPTTYVDSIPGAPFVINTIPATANPVPAPISACSVGNNTVMIRVSEPLDPAGIDLSSVRLVNVATGAQVPGSIVFHQAGTIAGIFTVSQIDYVAWAPLVHGQTYEVILGPSVKDLGGNPVQPVAGNPNAQLFFQTAPVASVSQPLDEPFDTTANLGDLTGPMRWAGDGVLQAEQPTSLVGNGADGALNAPAGVTTILDTNEIVGGQSRQGIWNFTDVTIPATAIVRVVGPYLAHFRCLGNVNLQGTLMANAATGPFNSPNAYDKGPEQGIQNNNGGLNCEADGGAGNAGGGAGGTGSGITPPPGSLPTFQCTLRVLLGESGFGPTLNGQPNTGTPANPLYAAGAGGVSGCFPAAGAGCFVGDLGGLGGAGGTAGRIGEAGLPRVSTAACTPIANVVPPIAQPSPVPPAMVPPISVQSAGSGGGGGGDHLVPSGTPPNNDDQGGGGGGGGGGIRISCVGTYFQSGGIQARGHTGNTAQASGGGGGSGSGGEVWIQSFSTVTITAAAQMDVTGPPRLSPTIGAIGCSPQAAGGGGAGLIQIEAGQGPAATPSFTILPTPTPTAGAVFSAPPFPFGGTVVAEARSKFRYAGGFPDYTGAVETSSLGNAAGATLQIRYEGAYESVDSLPAQRAHDPATIKSTASGGGPITAANLDELDGYPMIRFVVTATYPPPPATPLNAVLPSVDQILINLTTPPACP